MAERICSMESCGRTVKCRGLCGACYESLRTRGLIEVRPKLTEAQRFWAKVDKSGECWLWTAKVHKRDGYGHFGWGRNCRLAHLWSYEHLVGPIPAGLQIDHLCRVPACVNPAHLEPVTGKVNVGRAPTHSANRTHCPSGHPYDEVNTYVNPKGERSCRQCARAASHRYLAKRRLGRLGSRSSRQRGGVSLAP